MYPFYTYTKKIGMINNHTALSFMPEIVIDVKWSIYNTMHWLLIKRSTTHVRTLQGLATKRHTRYTWIYSIVCAFVLACPLCSMSVTLFGCLRLVKRSQVVQLLQ